MDTIWPDEGKQNGERAPLGFRQVPSPSKPEHDLANNAIVASAWIDLLQHEIRKVIRGRDRFVEQVLIGLFCRGHFLVEGRAGIGKTAVLRALSSAINASFRSVPFTSDMTTIDLFGREPCSANGTASRVEYGPVFSNIVLAESINHAPTKTQWALLKAMQERQGPVGSQTLSMLDPFCVVATQRPVDPDYPCLLSGEQADYFMLKAKLDYPTESEERDFVRCAGRPASRQRITPVADLNDIRTAQLAAGAIRVDDKIQRYLVSLVRATREPEVCLPDLILYVEAGASPRAAVNLMEASKAHAFINGRSYVELRDVKAVAADVLCHRVILTRSARSQGLTSGAVIRAILESVPAPPM